MGAVGGAISFGIGSLMAGANATGVNAALVSAYAHGFTQGTLSTLQGGDFLTSAAPGAFSSLMGSSLNFLTASTKDITVAAITINGGGDTGGFTETSMGGNFWNGMKTGLIVAGLNHAAHLGVEDFR